MRPGAGLALEQAPELSVPFRFFLTAPLFGLLACAVLLIVGSEALAARWTAPALALSHLLVLGVITMVMCGALMQILPVMVGVSIPRSQLSGGLCHALLILGTIVLAFAFLRADAIAFRLAALVLSLAFVLLLGLIGHALGRAPRASESARGLSWVALALAVTVVLGVLLALGHAELGLALYRPAVTNLHLVWGLVGWVALLVAVVSWQVVPMFQMTPAYPRMLRRWLAPLTIAVLTWLSAAVFFGVGRQPQAILLATAVLVGFAGQSLWLLAQRKRARADVASRLWQFGLTMLVLASLLSAWQGLSGPSPLPFPAVLPVVLFMTGFALSIILAMLMKIMPFLVWLHLQQRLAERPAAIGRYLPPGIRTILPKQTMDQSAVLHMLAVLCLVVAVFIPVATRAAALLWAAHFIVLARWQLDVLGRYRRECDRLEQAAV